MCYDFQPLDEFSVQSNVPLSPTPDIKSYNIVVDLDQSGSFSRIKLIDLGDSVEIQPTTHHHFTHPTYRAPEGLLGMPWTTKVDLWALGTLVGDPSQSLPTVKEKPALI